MENILDQLKFNCWANLRLIDAAGDLNTQQFIKNMTSSFSSIQETFVHILWAEELWLERWQGRSFIPKLNPEDYPTIDSIKKKLESIHQDQFRYLKTLNSGEVDHKASYMNFMDEKWEYSLRQMIQHMIFHSTYHRGQLTTLLRQLGLKPPTTDYLIFVKSKL